MLRFGLSLKIPYRTGVDDSFYGNGWHQLYLKVFCAKFPFKNQYVFSFYVYTKNTTGNNILHQYAHSLHSIILNLCTNTHFLQRDTDDDKNISLLQSDAFFTI